MSWDQAKIICLRSMWLDGFPVHAISEKVGKSRNAIIGKAHRVGLPPHKLAKAKKGLQRERKKRIVKPKLKVIKPIAIPANSKRLMDLQFNECRWPLGDPKTKDFVMCGAKIKHWPYCEGHKQIAYRKKKDDGL